MKSGLVRGVTLLLLLMFLLPVRTGAQDVLSASGPVAGEELLIEDALLDEVPAVAETGMATGTAAAAEDDLAELLNAADLLLDDSALPVVAEEAPPVLAGDAVGADPLAELDWEVDLPAETVAMPDGADAGAGVSALEGLQVETEGVVSAPVFGGEEPLAAEAEGLSDLELTEAPALGADALDLIELEVELPAQETSTVAIPAEAADAAAESGLVDLQVESVVMDPGAADAAAALEMLEQGVPAAVTTEEGNVEDMVFDGDLGALDEDPAAAELNAAVETAVDTAVEAAVETALNGEPQSDFSGVSAGGAESVETLEALPELMLPALVMPGQPAETDAEGGAGVAVEAEAEALLNFDAEVTDVEAAESWEGGGVAGQDRFTEVFGEVEGGLPVRPPVAAEGEAMAPDAKDARWLSEGEALRREAFLKHAQEMLASADAAFLAADYLEAWARYEKAQRSYEEVGDVAESKEAREHIKTSITESKYRRALTLIRFGDLDEAMKLATDAGHEGHLKAVSLVEQIKVMQQERPTPAPREKARWMQEDYLAKSRMIRDRMRVGREFFMVGEYDEAQAAFESVLARDPHNSEAMRWREKVAQKRLRSHSDELISTREDMMAMVREKWNPQSYVDPDAQALPTAGSAGAASRVTAMDRRREEIRAKLDRIIIPELNFRQANINDVIEYIQDQSELYDLADDRTGRKGVNIILHMGQAAGAAAPAAAANDFDDPFADAFQAAPGDGGGGGGGGGGERLITFRAREISIGEALKIVTDISGLKYRIEGNVVMVVPVNAPDGEILFQMYDVMPTVDERIRDIGTAIGGGGLGGGGLGGGDFMPVEGDGGGDTDWKDFFTKMGVRWPEGSSIKHIPSVGKLMVANTAENLAIFEQRLAALNVVPSQIEIETRFVEIKQTDLNSLGIEYLLTDNWEIAQKQGRTFGTTERIVMPETKFTKGMRYLDPNSTTASAGGFGAQDNIMAFSSVLTNPELTVILHALEQKGNSDLLSAPKVTTQSGMEAMIRVVTEFIYPSDYNIEPGIPPIVNADGSIQSPGQPPVVTPSAFQTREVGVILAVLPEVSPEGQLINLTMTPEVVTEPTWRNYGQTFEDARGNIQSTPVEQPFFNTRSISTSIMIYDGATVVMGGMITEVRNEVHDKIPLLGDLPLIGKLFQSRYENSEKRNLLIFVTARLVDPGGRPLKQTDQMANVLKEQERLARQAMAAGEGAAGPAAPPN